MNFQLGRPPVGGCGVVAALRMFTDSNYLCFIAAAFLFVASTPAATSQAATQSQPSALAVGNEIFESNCAACHGLDGAGSERAPNIADSPNMKRRSNAEIFGIIKNGISGTGMPGFRVLTDSQIQALVAYLRDLGGPSPSTQTVGDATHGKAVFSGKAECSRCHMIAGHGGLIASDLSDYALLHSSDQMRNTILHPPVFRTLQCVKLTLHDGQTLAGRLRNEDNFSLQLQSTDGAFHFLARADIVKIETAPDLLMPADYASRLSAAEINDLIAYVTQAASASKSAPPRKRQREPDDDQE